ncbi:RDD domain containing protein [Lysobacter dokdonensis DS-58]|uniref:RDD domain containing protein n=1 Tax=Lysobacter dokdonensis DS-58 TaxID=1300345 RepID=A0A0A2WK58_9GAMM|nr:RDD family protein [Lysobacter dokdonensis]KGQ19107.1 RDD domain containing protein [Lysobacter dokdonensis DS-58]
MLDTVREVHTPEGVALRLPTAGPVPRALAWALDLVIRCGIAIAAGTVLVALQQAGSGLYAIVVFGLMWAYPIVCEGAFNGQTPGKRVMDLRVVSADGAPVGWLAAVVRNLLRTVDMLPFAYTVGLVSSLTDPHGRRLGDMVARTVVVHVDTQRARPELVPVEAHVPAVPLRPAEQTAVIAFAERAPRLTPERQRELADIADVATGARGDLGVRRLAGIANWLLGRR